MGTLASKFFISDSLVTVREYTAFTRETGYICTVDQNYEQGWLVNDIQLNFGKGKDVPMFRLSYQDALEYATWIECDIPTESGLEGYYVEALERKIASKWTVFCWTKTWQANRLVVVNGPYFTENQPSSRTKMLVPPDYVDDFEMVALRLMFKK
jgi:hypothetical protein